MDSCRKVSDTLTSESCQSRVGERTRDFGIAIHGRARAKVRLGHHSPVLNAALNGPFLEGQSQSYHFEEASRQTLRLFVDWIYTQHLDLHYQVKDADHEKREEEREAMYELWVLAEKYLIPSLQNLIMMEIERSHQVTEFVPVYLFKYVWANTASQTPLRRYLLDILLSCHEKVFAALAFDSIPRQVLIELLQAQQNLLPKKGQFLPREHMEDYMVKDPAKGQQAGEKDGQAHGEVSTLGSV